MAFGKILRPVFDPGLAVAPWWQVAGKTCVVAYKPKGTATLAESYINLANPGTYDAAPGVAPALTANGWSFAADAWFRMGIAVQDTWTCLVRCTCSESYAYLFSADSVSETQVLAAILYNLVVHAYVGGSPAVDASTRYPADDVVAIAGPNTYFNGAYVATASGVTSATSARFSIGCLDPGYGPYSIMTGVISALAMYSATLTAGEVAAKSAAMAAL